PLTRSLAWKLFSSRVQASSRRALSRLICASPCLSSIRSRKTSTISPGLISAPRPGPWNSFKGTRPSAFSPTSIRTVSFSIAITVPLITVPSSPAAAPSDSSNNAAKLSFEFPAVSVTAMRSPLCSRESGGEPRGRREFNRPPQVRARRRCPWSMRKEETPVRLPFRDGELAVDGRQRRGENRIGIERAGIDHGRVAGGNQRRRLAHAVARVTRLHILKDAPVYRPPGLALQLPGPAGGPRFRGRRQEQLGVGVGADHGADISPIEHGATLAARKTALKFQQGGPDPGDRGHHRRGGGDGFVAQPPVLEHREIERPGGAFRDNGVGRVAQRHRFERDGAVEAARVEMSDAEMQGDAPRNGAFAGAGRSVDRDDHVASLIPGRYWRRHRSSARRSRGSWFRSWRRRRSGSPPSPPCPSPGTTWRCDGRAAPRRRRRPEAARRCRRHRAQPVAFLNAQLLETVHRGAAPGEGGGDA